MNVTTVRQHQCIRCKGTGTVGILRGVWEGIWFIVGMIFALAFCAFLILIAEGLWRWWVTPVVILGFWFQLLPDLLKSFHCRVCNGKGIVELAETTSQNH